MIKQKVILLLFIIFVFNPLPIYSQLKDTANYPCWIDMMDNPKQGLYIGIDIGVFYKKAFLDDWVYLKNGFPASARVIDFDYRIDNNRVCFIDNSAYSDSLFWDFGDFTYNKEFNPYHDYKSHGSHKVFYVVCNFCNTDFISKTINITGIDDVVNNNKLMIYPNPNKGSFNLKYVSGDFGNIFVNIYNMSGQKKYSIAIIKNINLSYLKS
ncbi:MAG: T9SS type A sorting domain-containing protein [Bacteroidetes bacterium]|nr:T9SS type A sorting domain-containing protein [Bacteroidota bacterium]